MVGYRPAQFPLVDIQLHDHPLPADPGPVQALDGLFQALLVGEEGGVHRDPRSVERRRGAGQHDHAASQFIRSRKCHGSIVAATCDSRSHPAAPQQCLTARAVARK